LHFAIVNRSLHWSRLATRRFAVIARGTCDEMVEA